MSVSLASRGSVLGLEPCVLDSTSDIYTALIVIKAALRIVMLDWLNAQIFYQIKKQFQYMHKNCGIVD